MRTGWYWCEVALHRACRASIVISYDISWLRPSITAPCAWLIAMLGLTIWLPMSPATHTLFTFTRFVGVDRDVGDLGEVAAVR